mgnify:CR=1 FL=1
MTGTSPRPPVTAVLSVADMRRSDAYTIEHFTDAETLMARAGRGIFDACAWHGRVAVVCGSGNNAGDGYVLAALLADAGVAVQLYILEEKFSASGAHFFAECRARGVPVSLWQAGTDLGGYDFVVDCIFGTGFHGEVRGVAADAIRAINQSGAFVVSADINSGMNGDTGEGDLCVVSSLTVSIGFYQPGHFRGRAPEVIGRLVNCDIGILPLGEILEYR